MAIDTHMHINSLLYKDIAKPITNIILNKSLEAVINIGLNKETSIELTNLTEDFEQFYGAVGIHPLYLTEDEDISFLYELATQNKIVAIGEIGLDFKNNNYYHQKRMLIKQIALANELHLPVIIHANNKNEEIIHIFKTIIKPEYGCVFHCFQPDIETLKYLISQGYYISFAGRITYKTAFKSHEILKYVPEEFFLIETDAPYITPEPIRDKENESSNIKYIIQKISEIKNLSYEEIEQITTINAKRLFKKLK